MPLPIGTLVAVYAPSSGATALGYVSQSFKNGRVRVRTYGSIGSRRSWIVEAMPINSHTPKDVVRRVSVWYQDISVKFVAIV
jgi:hypothetical protein